MSDKEILELTLEEIQKRKIYHEQRAHIDRSASEAGAKAEAEYLINFIDGLINKKPRFKVGDKVRYLPSCGTIMTIAKIEKGEYIFADNMGHVSIAEGNKWTLVEELKPKFHVGDYVHPINDTYMDGTVEIIKITDTEYITDDTDYPFSIAEQDKWELVESAIKPKFKIGDKVKEEGSYLTHVIEDIVDDCYKMVAYAKDGTKGQTVFSKIKYQDKWKLVEDIPEIKEGNWLRRKRDGLEAKVISVGENGSISVECEDWTEDAILESEWELIKEPLNKETEEAIEEFSTTVANGLMKQLKDNLPDGHYLKETIDTNDNCADSDEQSKFKEFSKVQRRKDGQVAIVHSVHPDGTMTISRKNKEYTVLQSEYDLYDMYKVKFTEEPLTDSFEEELEEMCNQLLGNVDSEWMHGELSDILGTDTWLKLCESVAKQFKNGLLLLAKKEELPIDADLEAASDDYVKSSLVGSPSVKKNAYKAGAVWQKEKDRKWLADNHKQIFNNGWEDGYEDGRDSMEEDLLKDALIGHITNAGSEYGYMVASFKFDCDHTFTILMHPDSKAKYGDEVKIIIMPNTSEYIEGPSGSYSTTTK